MYQHIKFDRRFNTIVEAGHKRNKKVKRLKRIDYKNRRIGTLLILGIVLSTFGIIGHAQTFEPKPQQVEAKEEAVIPLTKEQGFEQVAMTGREPVARESIEQTIERYFGKDAETALAVAKAESGLRADALGDTDTKYPSAGVFQIRLLPGRNITKEQMFDVEANIAYAKALYDRSGWYPWSAWKNGNFKKYLGGK